MEARQFIRSLEDALSECRFKDVSELVDRLDPDTFDDKAIKKTLGLIRRKRLFSELEKAASLFVATGATAPIVRCYWAQALLDQNRIGPALGILRVLDAHAGEEDPEKPEVVGLIGRGHKQNYMNTADVSEVQPAIDAYQRGWEARRGDYRWHGINLVALAKRAERDGVPIEINEPADDIARKVLEEIEDLEQRHVWDYGTAMEASLALGDKDRALRWAKQYVSHPDTDAFELGSTLRQLREVWRIQSKEEGQALDAVLAFELVQREGGEVSLEEGTFEDTSGFEAVYGPESYVRLQWLESLTSKLCSVARVKHRTTGEPFGTGFLVDGAVLHPDWAGQLLFVTNSHVVSDDASDESPLRPDNACAEFTRVDGRPVIALGSKRFHSKRTELDAWICDIEQPEGVSALDLSFYPPLVADEQDAPQRCFVAGHPGGGELVVSLFNNTLIGYEVPYVHYKSPTEGGSSGSPVFNRALEVFALHHRARRALQANEGVLFDNIKESIGASAPA